MKKKIVVLTMAAILAMSSMACGSGGDASNSGTQGGGNASATNSGEVANKDKPLVWFNRQPSNSSTGELDMTALNFNKDTYYVGFDANQGAELQGQMIADYIEKNIDTSGMMIFDFEHFKALCIGAKDCKAPLMNTIQGNLGAIVVKCPLSQMTEYEICYNDETSEVKSFEKKHRLIYEFKEFIRMIKENDVKKQKEMLELSLLISKLMEEGRMQEGIVFDNDK